MRSNGCEAAVSDMEANRTQPNDKAFTAIRKLTNVLYLMPNQQEGANELESVVVVSQTACSFSS